MVSFRQVSPQKPCIHLSSPHTCYMSRPSHSRFDYPNNIGLGVQIVKLLITYFSPFPVTASLLDPNILLRNITIIFNLRTAAFKAYCAIWVRRSKFRHQASPTRATRRKVELWARNVREFCLNADFHVTFRNLLHAVKLRHGTDGFTSSPKEGVLRIFRPKNPKASAGCEPASLGTSRPPKSLSSSGITSLRNKNTLAKSSGGK
jgi:hypothetical protein